MIDHLPPPSTTLLEEEEEDEEGKQGVVVVLFSKLVGSQKKEGKNSRGVISFL